MKHEDQLARDGEADSATEDAPNPAIAARETVLRKILRSEGARLVQDQDRWLIQFPSSFGSPTHVLLTPAEYEAVKDLVP